MSSSSGERLDEFLGRLDAAMLHRELDQALDGSGPGHDLELADEIDEGRRVGRFGLVPPVVDQDAHGLHDTAIGVRGQGIGGLRGLRGIRGGPGDHDLAEPGIAIAPGGIDPVLECGLRIRSGPPRSEEGLTDLVEDDLGGLRVDLGAQALGPGGVGGRKEVEQGLRPGMGILDLHDLGEFRGRIVRMPDLGLASLAGREDGIAQGKGQYGHSEVGRNRACVHRKRSSSGVLE
ncbi:MAG: hypothetical protein IPK00_07135 [Deltaproteobacteria bacterium]|nr:hypothetical protein [Deltaproteobacteria bacterium]